MNQKRKKYYEDIAKSKGKIALIEECNVSLENTNLKLVEKVSLIEDTSGHSYEALGIVKNVPISRYTENANGRVYNRSLWESVKKKKMGEGSLCMADHPEDDKDSVKDVYGVWHNMQINEDSVTMDLYLVEEKPLRVLKAGGSVGTSSVGYGQMLEDNKTVAPESFELERAADLVIHPSQGTYAKYENLVQESIKPTEIKENIEKENNILKESETNKTLEIKETKIEEKRIDKNMDKLDAVLRNQARAVFKEAKTSTNFKESIEELKKLKDTVPAEMSKLHEEVDIMIDEVNHKFEEQLASTGTSLKEKETLLEEITVKYQTLEAAHNSLKENYKTCSAIVEKVKNNKDVKELTEMVEKLANDRKLAEADIKQFQEEISLRDKDIACFTKERRDMQEDIKVFKASQAKLKESLAKMVKLVKKMKEDENEDIVDISKGDIIDQSSDLPEPDSDVMDIDIETIDADMSDIQDTVEPVETLDLDELDADALMAEAEEMSKEKDDDEGAADMSFEEEEKEDEGSKEDEKEDEKEKEDKEKKSESVIKANKAVIKHYKEAIVKNPALKDIKRQILTSKSLYEATQKIEVYLNKKSQESEMISLRESAGKKSTDLKTYSFKR